MIPTVDETHDPALRSWVESANGETEFPIQNLPLGIFRRADSTERARVGMAIGDMILDLATAQRAGALGSVPATHVDVSCLNPLMAAGRPAWKAVRRAASQLLRAEAASSRLKADALVPLAEAELLLPAQTADYTDFYASIHHATNVGSMFRPDNPLLPNYKYVPIGYHGRASSLVPSGATIRRPSGQRKPPDAPAPTFGPSRTLDYECEVGCYVGPGTMLGDTLPAHSASEHIFGLCLVNDWSARDIQSWEYQPLGPFLSKSFATTVSPWVVTTEALAPFRIPASKRPDGDPQPLAYLHDDDDQALGGVDIELEVWLRTRTMRERGVPATRLSGARFGDMYWTFGQMLTHHASNGCNLRPGDLLASGTVSGPSRDARGCMLELTWRGAEPVELPDGERRAFLEDGDEVVLRGSCTRDGFARIGFGECRGTIIASA